MDEAAARPDKKGIGKYVGRKLVHFQLGTKSTHKFVMEATETDGIRWVFVSRTRKGWAVSIA